MKININLLPKIIILFICFSACNQNYEESTGYIMTVNGKISPEQMGISLPHEHITTDFIGAEKVKQPQYQQDSAVEIILPHLNKLLENGVNTLFECTPNYIGRDVKLLQRLSELSQINIITNTGYYSAVDKKFLPAHAYTETKEEISAHWEKEWMEGINGTGIKPGFIKLGVGKGKLDSIEVKLLEAAILLSKKSGLTIAMHTGDGEAAKDEQRILEANGLESGQMIWVHAQNGTDEERELLAKKGVWVSLDGISEKRIEEYLQMVSYLKEKNLLHQLLISHDDGWSVENNDGEISLKLFGNGNSKPYSTIFEIFVERLTFAGFTRDEITQIMVENPKKAYVIDPIGN
ncbi:phosphotriesterase family protein [Flexithrix dorotheae]|uniref:phosphotriesterase family protein n=1 Tax=Flexithrix dorotheae TaxID=70993 RepID=UPI00036F2F59|nr:TatD family hydrolase [Flexithrix dorotheae]